MLLDLLAPGNSTVGPPLTPLATPLDPLPRTAGPYGQYDGYIRSVDFTYDARGKLRTATNAKGMQEAMTFDYTPMGHLRSSTYASRYYDYVAGLSSSATLTMSETIRPDAMGTPTWRQTATQNYNFGGAFYSDGRYNASAKRLPTYTPNTGRLRRTSFTAGPNDVEVARDTLWYDAAGNTYAQLHQDFQTLGTGASRAEATDRVMYYNAADQLVAVDARIAEPYGWSNPWHSLLTFDSYRYDALGRRVFTRSSRRCLENNTGVDQGTDFWFECNLGYVQRTVWDGSKVLYEVRMPDQSQHWEKDGLAVGDTLGVANNAATDKTFDRDAYYGRVGYVYGGAIDKPLVMLRQDYGDHNFRAGQNPKPYRRFQPFALYPQWDLRGEPSLGTSADGGISRCEMDGTVKRCTYGMAWTQVWAPNGKQIDPLVRGWAGSLLQDKREPNGLLYRRNRYLDPATGRFTQPDPIGLAGGLNAYGYASGDPVSFADPFGLMPDTLVLYNSDAKKDEGLKQAIRDSASKISGGREAFDALNSAAEIYPMYPNFRGVGNRTTKTDGGALDEVQLRLRGFAELAGRRVPGFSSYGAGPSGKESPVWRAVHEMGHLYQIKMNGDYQGHGNDFFQSLFLYLGEKR